MIEFLHYLRYGRKKFIALVNETVKIDRTFGKSDKQPSVFQTKSPDDNYSGMNDDSRSGPVSRAIDQLRGIKLANRVTLVCVGGWVMYI